MIPGYDENLIEINQDHCDPDWSVVSGPATRFSSDIINDGGRYAVNTEYTDCPSNEMWGHFIYPNVKIPQNEGGNATSSDIRCSVKYYNGSNTTMKPNTLFTAARPRNIALRAIIKYK